MTTAAELVALIKKGTGAVEKPQLEEQIDAICNSLVGLVIEHQRLSVEADRSKNQYKRLFAEKWATARKEHGGKGGWTAKDIEQNVITDTATEELIADLDDTLAKSQGELVDVMKMVLAGKRTLLQSMMTEYNNSTGRGGNGVDH